LTLYLQSNSEIDEWHQIRKQQDEEYEESLKIDHQKELQKQCDCKEEEEQRHKQEVTVFVYVDNCAFVHFVR